MDNAAEIARGERFQFGQNWSQFLPAIDEERIQQAEQSLKEMLEVDSLSGKTFLDIGSGSGLFSLAARRLGARVHSFDFDPKSVYCTTELRKNYFRDDASWKIEEASVLDGEFMKSLGQFDVVYSWGVLHHTGDLWTAMENAQQRVAPGGKLFIALYNDTGSQSTRWFWIKKTYNGLPGILRSPFAALVWLPTEMKLLASSVVRLQPKSYIDSWTQYRRNRGMTKWRDIIDWVGGYPYEVSTPDEVFDFCRERGFLLTKLNCGRVGLGCNQFVFVKSKQLA
ncbi:MAG TPA: methyltransferase domain-containing protein [Pyrinomonadaceae bacterium]|jgi:2-polyprenyl-6-hydroxyphenyl methylase/3-demethylubiquinone-9 3-methyltransferase|nr:methyltransferase domain-containing protein [Pyrinomonadaceae bacterium]